MQPGSLVGFGVVFVVLTWTLSALSLLVFRVARDWLRRVGPAAERRAVELVATIPVLLGGVVVAILLVRSGLGADHCREHHHEAHFCLMHGGTWSGRVWAVTLVSLAGVVMLVRSAVLAATIARRRQTIARLRMVSHRADGLWWVDSTDAVCFVAGIRAPEIFVSTGAWESLDDDERAAMLTHERAHIRHHDIARRFVVDMFLFVGSPFVATVRGLWDSATERLCDARAAAETGDAESVASAMVKVSRLGVRARLSAASFPPPAQAVEERVEAVLADRSAGDRAARVLLAIVVTAVVSIVLVAGTHAAAIHDVLEAILG